jgi:hypothetical protein
MSSFVDDKLGTRGGSAAQNKQAVSRSFRFKYKPTSAIVVMCILISVTKRDLLLAITAISCGLMSRGEYDFYSVVFAFTRRPVVAIASNSFCVIF